MLTLWRKKKGHRYELRFDPDNQNSADLAVKVMVELTDHMGIGQDEITVIENKLTVGAARLSVLDGNRSEIVIVIETPADLGAIDFLSE
jgi:hypothetical protein